MDKSLFARLKRLFSTDVLIRNIGGNQLKVVDINNRQITGGFENNLLMDKFNRIYNNYTSLYGSQLNINYQILRSQLYSDYDVMDAEAIIASALDVIADECTLKNNMGEVLQIKSSNEHIQKILYNLFYDILNIEFNLWSWIRQMLKYGDFFIKLEIMEKYGVVNVIPFTAFHIERLEIPKDNKVETLFRLSPEGNAAGSTGYYSVMGSSTLENGNHILFGNHEMAHFRLITDVNFMPYGRSYLEPARKVYKQYTLMKDAMLIHRIVRAPEKRIFYINIGSIAPNEVESFMEKTISKMKRIPYMDPQTGEYNLRFNMANMMEDYFIPVRGNDQTTKIDSAKGLEYDGISDVTFLRDELFIALKVPKAFLGYEQDTSGKATLASQDVRFAHTIDRIQRIVLQELYKIALIHLYSQGLRDEELTNFELSLTTPSIIYDQEKINLLKEQMDLAVTAKENQIFPMDYIYSQIFHLSEDKIEEMRDLMVADQKRFFRLNQILEEGNDPLESGKSYGTPHDLASQYGRGRYKNNSFPVKAQETPKGRPQEKVTDINTQDNAFGRNRLGKNNKKEIMLEENKKILSLLENPIDPKSIDPKSLENLTKPD